ncbi:hypothetical protein GCM10011576_17400 [Micromonospora parathelypteridis]|uniref:Uncharacterized protein n=1 Tax=Micromonospora parathelypteridis TaxID=1839617 RepID=A0A840VKM3_9ACTN|nr:hypothetical protein [Micromonospora parathelypteridis]GGO10154.1 hypothetical protein GCM10011576_17400 [Micromonospora parathelypteridis]
MKAHRTDLVSFAFGLVFLALSAWWLLGQILGLALPAVGWFLASALILIGVFGLVGALRSGRSGRPEQTAEAGATEAVTPVSGASAPVSGAAALTSGAALPAWEAQQSTWDAPLPGSTPETSTTEVRAPEAPTTDVIHPAWLAHPPSEPQTNPVPAQPDNETDEPTVGILDRATPVEGNEPTRPDRPVDAVDDEPGNEREGRRGEA